MGRWTLCPTLLALGLGCAAGRITYSTGGWEQGAYRVGEACVAVQDDGIGVHMGELEWKERRWVGFVPMIQIWTGAPWLLMMEVDLPRTLEAGRTYSTQEDAAHRCQARGLYFGSGWKELHGSLRVASWSEDRLVLGCTFRFHREHPKNVLDGSVTATRAPRQ